MRIVDEVTIYIKAGDGGKGCKSFYIDPLTHKKHPDGGDGGKGGDVIIEAKDSVWDLNPFRFKKNYEAESGKHGSSNKKKGRDGKDLYLYVPQGTIIRDADHGFLLKDLLQGKIIVAKGGKGGRGNGYTRGEVIPPQKGEEKRIHLELKLIADIGLVGLPNAGKTTLINALCGTRAKVAAYPFTTLSPHLGTMIIDDKILKIADIPGLIKDAHKGKGLGDKFLRHIERTKLLLFILDLAEKDLPAWDAFSILRNEIRLYHKSFEDKPYLIAGNKIDLEEAKKNLKILKGRLPKKVYPISALKKIGFDSLLKAMLRYL